jgi:hypothetical protein
LGQFSKNYRTFYKKNCQKALKNMVLGSGIRDPGSGKNPFRIPDPGVKKAPDPGSGSATLARRLIFLEFLKASIADLITLMFSSLQNSEGGGDGDSCAHPCPFLPFLKTKI